MRGRFIKFYKSKCVHALIDWNPARKKMKCEGNDMVIQMFLEAVGKVVAGRAKQLNDDRGERGAAADAADAGWGDHTIGTAGPPIQLFGASHALVQHLSRGNHTTVGLSSQPLEFKTTSMGRNVNHCRADMRAQLQHVILLAHVWLTSARLQARLVLYGSPR